MKNTLQSLLVASAMMCCGYTAKAQTTNYVINYNGSSNYINVGATVGNGVRSIEFWFKPSVTINSSTSIPGYSFIERNDGGQTHEYGAYIKGSDWSSNGNVGHLAFFARYSGTLHEVISNSSSWTAGTWYHVAGVIDPTTGMRLYINGVLQASADAVATLPVQIDNVNPTYLGVWGSAFSRYFNGEMDELRLWNRSISQSEIQAKMCLNLTPASETGLQAYYKFNEGSGTQVIDATANAYNGTVSGANWLVDSYCTAGGIENYANNIGVNIYPNPAKEMLNVELGIKNETATIEVYNMLGACVKQFITHNSSFIINVADLANGMYSILVSQKDKVYTSKLIIEK
ncbi:MAG TPA: LamG-like jellyroll fold domain-containing protein [Bacteroidia bacterium]